MPPKICEFYITMECNATCEFCELWQGSGYQDKRRSEYQEASLEKILSVVKGFKIKGIEEIRITGGEPLLSENLPPVLKEAKRLGLHTTLFTNCLLYPERAKEIKGLTDTLFFSLDYPYPEMHNRSRGRNIFNKVIKSIEVATHFKENPIIFYTVSRDSILYLPEAIEFCEKFSLDLFLNPVYDFFGTQGLEQDSISYLQYCGRRKNVFVNLAMLEFIKSRGNNNTFPRCRASQTVVTLLPSGETISPCFFNPGGREGKEAVCSGCMKWPYMLPSFTAGFDKYRMLDWYSKYNWRIRNKFKIPNPKSKPGMALP